MLTYLRDILDSLISIARTMNFVDYLDILLLTVIVYWVLKLIQETRAVQLIKGILFFLVILVLLRQFDFKVIGSLSQSLMNVGFVAIIVMFQPELRRILERIGRTNVVRSIAQNLESDPTTHTSQIIFANEQVADACESLSRTATGALIVMERQTKLGEEVATGVILNARPSAALFGNIFFHNSPLHDGAVVVRDGVILAAGCFLPKPQKEELIPKELGSRHRAGIGMSEGSDAVVIIVSEETGMISVAENGVLTRGLNKLELLQLLNTKLLPERSEAILRKEIKFKWRRKKSKAEGESND